MSKKSAIARLLSDFIKADNIIEKDEIDVLSELSEEFHIDEEDKQEAERMQFAEAVAELSALPWTQRKEVLAGLGRMTVADGRCVPMEAMLMLAVKYSLAGDQTLRRRVKLLRGDSLELGLSRFKIIYVESEYDEALNAEIQANLRNINNELNMIGVDFVYIPQVANDFAQMSKDYLRNVISYLAPNLKPERREAIMESLCGITTRRFCCDLLSRKLGITELQRTKPALLISIGDSSMPVLMDDGSVSHRLYTQYLHLELSGNVLSDIRMIVDDYKGYVENLTTTTMSPNANRIMYHGFHRLLLDLHIYSGKKQDCTLLIDVARGKVIFRETDSELTLTRKIRAMYLTMLQQSLCGRDKVMRGNAESLKAFRRIYYELGAEEVENSTYESDLTVALTRIRKELAENHPMVQNIERYMPVRGHSNTVTVNVDPDMVWVKTDGKEMRLVDSPWRNFGK